MSVFTNKTITNAGMNLIAQGMAGGSITFKNILLGSGTFTGQDLANQTALIKVENTLPITGVNRNGSTVSLTTTLTPQQIQSDYAWSELGVIAEGETGGEILYLYGHTTQTSIISRNGLDEKIIQVTLLVSNVQNVTATIDSSLVYLTQAELDNHNEGEDSHADIRQELARLNEQMAAIDISWDSVNGKPSTFQPSPHTHSQMDLADKYIDGRGTGNKPPSFYKGKGHYLELVNGSEVALSAFPNSCKLETICAWHDTTGGVRQRISPSGTNVTYHRYSTNDTTWSGWVRSNDGGNADTVDGKHASEFASATGVNNNLKLGQYVKFYDYDDGGSDTTMKQAYLRDGVWYTSFSDVRLGGSNLNIGYEINSLKALANSAGKMYMPQGSAKITFPNPPSRKGDIYLGKMTCKYGGYIAVRATFLDKVSHVTGHVKVRTLRATGSNSESTFDTATLTAFNIAPGATLDYNVGASSYKNVAYTSANNVSTTETYVIKVEAGQILQFGAFGINTGESVITNIQIIYEEVAL